ncbi:CPBP family glutamic-type intramembrane protease [Paraclostridium ghonii]|uniref:CAAX prenyl protease 2/Lysostaphin resistance protein A-like domain-containing protein n=1 Tax=Paraclostridium ghonii TaxID=29358 RepID=A0ABU0N1Z9_9FIRM|nr:CPBP family glutamic-type intramembrane protease [Paeniclostridium ghonii]MDQ0557150.1 hypothetical protein [Paeniclostridium ghonii]
MRKRSIKLIWGMFVVFIIVFILNLGFKSRISATERMFFVLQLWAVILSIILIIKNKLPKKHYIKISIILSLLVVLSYSSMLSIQSYFKIAIFQMTIGFIVTLISSLAIFSTFEKFKEEKLIFLNTTTKKSVFVSILLGIGFGIVLGFINFLLGSINNTPNLHIRLSYFIVSLSPAIYEEVVMRSLFYAFCIHLMNGKIETKKQQLTCWFMMIIPHVIIHTPDTFIFAGVNEGILSIVVLALIFGLPFAILQRKRDITSAMIAHGLTDFIRFCFYGLPF